MTARSTIWTPTSLRASKRLAISAVLALAAMSMGCGVSPAYEPEPRVPGGYTQAPPTEPPTSEELAAEPSHAVPTGEVALGADASEYSDTDPSALTEFKPALEGHGAWVDDSTYGTVWVPAAAEVGSDFVPYTTSGHWTYDDAASYVWVSDYSWGWAPFHYGRWAHVSRHGWAWIPGRTYAGAWVVWRTGGSAYDYVGWAPAGPDWYWYNGYAVGWTFGYTPYYSYCHHNYLYEGYGGGHVVRWDDPRSRDYEARTRPYAPANPSVAGPAGRVAATPGVGPVRSAAAPRVGPRPSELGIKAENVVAPPIGHAGLGRAQALASPTTAVATGAAPPIQTSTFARRRPTVNDSVIVGSGSRPFESNRAPAVTSRADAVARAPQVLGVNPAPPSARRFLDPPSASTSYGSSPSIASSPPSAAYRGQQAAQPSSAPTFRSSSSATQPALRSAPSPSFSQPQPTYSQAQPTVRSSPSVAQPVFRSAPVVSSPPPSFRASPSVAAPHYTAPSFARPSAPSRSISAPAVRRGR